MLIADPSDTSRLNTIRCSSVLQDRIVVLHGRADSRVVATVLSTNRRVSVGEHGNEILFAPSVHELLRHSMTLR